MTRPEIMHHRDSKAGGKWILLVMLILGCIALPFLPMVLSVIEQHLLKTNYVQQFFRELGILQPLKDFYDWVFR